MPDLPMACSLDAESLRARRAGLLTQVLAASVDREVLPDGYRFRFAAGDEIVGLIARAVDAERQCCRFLRFEITIEPDAGPIGLAVTGPSGTREFLAGLLDL